MTVKKIGSLFLVLLIASGCGLACAEEEKTALLDMKGREIALDAPAERIICLQPADCEILYALGAGEALVGRGEFVTYPEEALKAPAVASGSQTNIEQIIALEPQVVIMSTMDQTTEQVEALEKAGITVVVTDAQDLEGVYTAIGLIGALVGREEEAAALVESMQTTFDEIALASPESGKTVYFEVSPLQWGLWTAGKGTFMDELAAICGLTNAFADVEGWAEISEEQVLERDPDYIITITMYFGEGPTPVEEILSRPGWENLKAVKQEQILNADSNAISLPGPRLADAALEIFEFISEEE